MRTKSEFGGHAQIADSGRISTAPTKNGSGQAVHADSGQAGGAAPVTSVENGQDTVADSGHSRRAVLSTNGGQYPPASSGQKFSAAVRVVEDGLATPADSGQSIGTVLDNLVTQCRLREDYHRAEKRLILQLKAICRRRSGGKGKVADDLFASLSKQPDPETQGLFIALETLREQRKLYEKGVQRLAKELPCSSWVETVPGVSFLSLGLLVAELEPVLGQINIADSGQNDDARRRQESRARYRLGLALVEGERQRKVKDKALAERMGYSPRRRSIMWNVGACMIKASNRETAQYYDIYLRRKAFEMARGIKRGHAHNRAARYMTSKFLRHFLAAWNARAILAQPIAANSIAPSHLTWGQPARADSGHGSTAP